MFIVVADSKSAGKQLRYITQHLRQKKFKWWCVKYPPLVRLENCSVMISFVYCKVCALNSKNQALPDICIDVIFTFLELVEQTSLLRIGHKHSWSLPMGVSLSYNEILQIHHNARTVLLCYQFKKYIKLTCTAQPKPKVIILPNMLICTNFLVMVNLISQGGASEQDKFISLGFTGMGGSLPLSDTACERGHNSHVFSQLRKDKCKWMFHYSHGFMVCRFAQLFR